MNAGQQVKFWKLCLNTTFNLEKLTFNLEGFISRKIDEIINMQNQVLVNNFSEKKLSS